MSNRNSPSNMGRGISEKLRRQLNGYGECSTIDTELIREICGTMIGKINNGRGNRQPLIFDTLETISNMTELEYIIYHTLDSLALPTPRRSNKRHSMWEERILLAKRVKDLTDNGYQTIMPQMKWGRVDINGIVERSRYNL